MAFIFDLANNEIQSGTLDILNGQFDISFVTAPPVPSNTIISNLTLSSLAPAPLVNNSTSSIWSYQNIILPLNSYSVVPIGFVISKRSSASFDNSNRVIYYSEFTNSIGQPITYTPGLYRINVNFNSSGLINFNATNEYFSGPYINNEPTPKGLLYLLGSSNNTVAFTNPAPTKVNILGSVSGIASRNIIDRNIVSDNGQYDSHIGLDFLTRKVRIGTLGIILNNLRNGLTLWGSNNDTGALSFTQAGIANDINWVQIGSLPTLASGWNLVNSNSSVYWRYIRLSISAGLNPFEIEFYNSSILSTNLNLV